MLSKMVTKTSPRRAGWVKKPARSPQPAMTRPKKSTKKRNTPMKASSTFLMGNLLEDMTSFHVSSAVGIVITNAQRKRDHRELAHELQKEDLLPFNSIYVTILLFTPFISILFFQGSRRWVYESESFQAISHPTRTLIGSIGHAFGVRGKLHT